MRQALPLRRCTRRQAAPLGRPDAPALPTAHRSTHEERNALPARTVTAQLEEAAKNDTRFRRGTISQDEWLGQRRQIEAEIVQIMEEQEALTA